MSDWKKRPKEIEIPGMNKLNKIKCTVCGNEFVPTKKERYSARENDTQGGLCGALSGYTEPGLYDCFDCPVCGCQVAVKRRMREEIKSEQEK